MKNKSIELEILRDKLDRNIELLKRSDEVERNEDLSGDEMQQRIGYYLDELSQYRKVTVEPRVLTRKKGLFGKMVVLFKRLARKIVAWYLQPVCDDQTRYNDQAYLTLTEMNALFAFYMEENKKQWEELKQMINEEREKMAEKYERETDSIKGNVKELQGKYEKEIDSIKGNVRELQGKSDAAFWNKRTTSQAGEDAIIAYVLRVLGIRLHEEKYLDLGANHAQELSNTYTLYENGMRGVLVEANPSLIPELEFMRKGDIILNRCISIRSNEIMPFYVLNGDGLSSPDIEAVNEVLAVNPALEIEKTVEIESITVNEILEQYFDEKPPVVLNVDIEGMEKEIISSIDFERFAPFMIVVERIDYSTKLTVGKRNDGLEELMKEKGYMEYAFTGINSIFINEKRLEEYRK